MKHGIIKIWVCSECQKEFLDRQVMCSRCGGFEFDLKYGGQIVDAEELTKLIANYKDDDEPDKNKKVRM